MHGNGMLCLPGLRAPLEGSEDRQAEQQHAP
jgi:hypothetical protein